MKHLPSTFVLICAALTSALPLVAESLRDAVADAERLIIRKYETPRARQMAMDDLNRILDSDMTNEEKIAAIHAEFSSAPDLSIPIQDKSAQTDNLADLIFRPPLQWTIHSIEIAYDIDRETNLLFSAESLFQEENSKNHEVSNGSSNKTTTSVGAKTQMDLDTGGDIKIKGWNPLNWFSAKVGYQWVTSGLAGKDNTKTKTSQWNERAQRALSNNYAQKAQILQNTNIRNCHLTFSISFKNNTDSVLSFNPRNVQIPIYADNEQLTYAEPETKLPEVSIFPNAYVDQMFRANLDNTKALKLIGYMCSNAPLIPLERGQFVISSEDGMIRNAILDSINIETVPFRCRNMELQIIKYNHDKPVTVADAMHALNEVFEKKPFTFDSNGNCVALMDVPLEKKGEIKGALEKLPVIEINGCIFSSQIPSSDLNCPLSEDGIMFDVVNIVSDDEHEDVWENSSALLQSHYVSCLLQFAERGDSQAQNLLGTCYESGQGTEQDYNEAFKWYQQAANQGIASSQCALGRFYLGLITGDGKGLKIDKTEGVKWLRKAAEQEYVYAESLLGFCYLHGNGVEKSESMAEKWIHKAAEHGYFVAQYSLGNFFYDGTGVRQNYAEAVNWYRKAADYGLDVAQNMLGLCYAKGRGVREDKAEAVKWYRKAANQGYDVAQCNLGNCYYYGDGVSQDYSKAVNWYWKAAEQDCAIAFGSLGKAYLDGKGVKQDDQEAEKWLLKAAEQNVDCFYLLGFLYYQKKDYANAITWYRKAADNGDIDSQELLGVCYKDGFNDYGEAMKWFKKAADQGNTWAQFWLGYCNEYRLNNTTEAVRWYHKAANQGNENAKAALRRLGY